MSLEDFAPDLSRPRTVAQLARALGVSSDIFEYVAGNRRPEDIYVQHRIPKRSQYKLPTVPVEDSSGITVISLPNFSPDNYRIVWEPYSPAIKLAHKSTAQALTKYLSKHVQGFPHKNAYGYVRGRSTRDHAARHKGASKLFGADIKNFFPSITVGRVELALRDAGINKNVSGVLASFLTINDHLPLGLSSSPLLANLVAHKMDEDFSRLALELNCTYTRYADDITFSGEASLPTEEQVENILKRHLFKPNTAKYRRSKRGQKHYVTGLSVADSARPHAPRKLKKRLRQELFFIEKYGIENHRLKLDGEPTLQHVINRIDGMVSYIASIEPTLAFSLREKWAFICNRDGMERSFEPRPYIKLREAEWLIDEAELKRPDGTHMLAVCCAEIHDINDLEIKLVNLFEEEAGDAFGTASATKIIKNGLHWSESSLSQKERVVKLLAVHPLRAFVAMGSLGQGSDYAEMYLSLLARLLFTIMRTADDATLSITVEANSSKVSENEIKEAISKTYALLESNNQRRPVRAPSISVVRKGSRPALSVPDVMLGALASYAQHNIVKGTPEPLIALLFEQLRSKFSVIFDDHAKIVFHARNPFRRWGSAESN